MNIKLISKILSQHGIPYVIFDNKIYADSMVSGSNLFEGMIDLTGVSKSELYSWLGY